MMPYRAIPCSCERPSCKDWYVGGVPDLQGISFTEKQARVVAGLLNFMDEQPLGSATTVALLLQYQNRS